MNAKMTRYILFRMLGMESLLLLIPALVGLIYQEPEGMWFLVVAGIELIVFLLFGLKKPEDTKIYAKEGMIIVCLAWILWSAFGALPGFLMGVIPNYVDSYFEIMSGFTTTGSTILTQIEGLPYSFLFWRSFTHWIGGMGVLMFVMLVGVADRSNSMYLMRAEVPGPEMDKLVPKAKQTARLLYGIYLGMTIILVILLLFGGMNLYDSIMHAFSTAGTGGFSNYGQSVAHFKSSYIEWVITIFMLLFGINFNLFFLLLVKEVKAVFKNEELRIYILIVLGAIICVTVNIASAFDHISDAIRTAAFQVASIISTTGFATADYNVWPMFSQVILMVVMLIGACASSTGGGIKVSRVLVMFKSVKKFIKQLVHPQSINTIRLNGKKVSDTVINGIYIYFLGYVIIFVTSVILVSVDNMDFGTTFSAVLTTMSNTGPGIGVVGPIGNFSAFSNFSKIILIIDMLVGRLEIMPFMMLFTLPIWRKKF
ncbi:MAG TPA: TrkH family potassium uptake protein [Candidatus Dorea intestinavium]|nr:TrkH family potassium uptake protein [Candidatus Dorea intestinavium]